MATSKNVKVEDVSRPTECTGGSEELRIRDGVGGGRFSAASQ